VKAVRHDHRLPTARFRRVVKAGLTLPGVVLAARYDGSTVLKVAGCFMAGLASHPSAEPDSLVIRAEPEARALWLEEAPDVYYLTEYYGRYPLVLIRLSKVEPAALRELLALSWRLTLEKARPRRPTERAANPRSILPRRAP
jgi:hypothetical protein